MQDTTIISYSRSRTDSLLSLAESRSRYMLPFGGRFRVVDFTIRNSIYAGARRTIIFNDFEDELEAYVARYGGPGELGSPLIKVISRETSDAAMCHNLIIDSNTAYYIIYNGDNPSIIDFIKILDKFKKSKSKASLFKLKLSGKASMAFTLLATTQKVLLNVVEKAVKNKQSSPNIFEMIINGMINKGIKTETVEAYYWAMKSIPEYYNINMEFLTNHRLASLIFHKSPIKSYIAEKGQALIGPNAKVANSLVSDNCKIYGTVMNSIIFPGVEIGENSIVRNSIILPNEKIGFSTNINKTIIDERTNINKDIAGPQLPDIGNRCYVGTSDGQLKNNEFPILNGSLTLIGKNCRIPDDARIGGACYIASGKGETYFQKNRHLYNGLSILN